MAKLTKSDVIHVADLSNLKLTEQEIKKFLPQLSKIVDFVGQLSEVDTKGVEPTNNTTGLKNVLRTDVIDVTRILPVNKATGQTNSVHSDLFKVAAILEGRTDK